MNRWCAIFFVSLLCLPFATSITVNPTTQQLTNPTDQVYTFVYSISNNDPQPRTIRLAFDPFSDYLSQKVTFSKQQFSLLPGEVENVQVAINPAGLGPETHTLKVLVYDGEEKLTSFELLTTVKGTPIEKYDLKATAGDTTASSAVPLSIELSNAGNIIGYAKLTLAIYHDQALVGQLDYPDVIQVLPNAKKNYDLVYTDRLDPGFYTAVVTSTYASSVINVSDQFSVRLAQSKERLSIGTDFIITFASLGNPTAASYKLFDENKKELASGTFFPQSGDLVVPTSTLAAGTYDLALTLSGSEQHITIIMQDKKQYGVFAITAFIVLVVLYAFFSYRKIFALHWRIFKLRRAVAHRQAIVTSLINRSHRLVDEYSRTHGGHQQTSGVSGTATQRP